MWKYKETHKKNREWMQTVYVAVNICEKCGSEFQSQNHASAKYCPTCSDKIRRDQNRERVRRFRNKQKDPKNVHDTSTMV